MYVKIWNIFFLQQDSIIVRKSGQNCQIKIMQDNKYLFITYLENYFQLK